MINFLNSSMNLWGFILLFLLAPNLKANVAIQNINGITTELSFSGIRNEVTEVQSWLSKELVITFDIRDVRGGNGDVATSYLMALDLIERLKFSGEIIFITHKDSRQILARMSGEEVKEGSRFLNDRVRVEDTHNLPSDLPSADVYIKLASRNGQTLSSPQYFNSDMKGLRRLPHQIPIHTQTIRIYSSVFSRGEQKDSYYWQGTTWNQGAVSFSSQGPGPGESEDGIYSDPVAQQLRDKTPEDIREFVLQQITKLSDPTLVQNLALLIQKSKLQGSQLALIYGLLDARQRSQFELYLQGLDPQKSTVLLSPSPFLPEHLSLETLKERVVFLDARKDDLPQIPELGKIYIVSIGSITHKLFTGLMAYSELPYIVAGDNAVSAAIQLGRPFVMTQVPWNQKASAHIWDKLKNEISGAEPLVDQLQKADLSGATDLMGHSHFFQNILAKTPFFNDRLFEGVHFVRKFLADASSKIVARECPNRDLALHVAFQQLLGSQTFPFEEFEWAYLVESGIYDLQRWHLVPSEAFSHPLLAEGVERILRSGYSFSNEFGLYVKTIQGQPVAHLRTELADLDQFLIGRGDLHEEKTHNAHISISRILQKLGEIGNLEALNIVKDTGLNLKPPYLRRQALKIYLNRHPEMASQKAIEEHLLSLPETEHSWFIQDVAEEKETHFRVEFLLALLNTIPADHYWTGNLQSKLRWWGQSPQKSCENVLAP